MNGKKSGGSAIWIQKIGDRSRRDLEGTMKSGWIRPASWLVNDVIRTLMSVSCGTVCVRIVV